MKTCQICNPGKKIGQVMHRYKEGNLHSNNKNGPIVKNRKQAIAIAISESNNQCGCKK
jgi:hypothetical protein